MKDIPIKSYSNFHLIQRALEERGFSTTILPLLPKYVTFTAPNGWQWLTKWAALSYPFMSVACKQISRDKALANSFVSYLGYTIPVTLRLPEQATQTDGFLARHAPLVVKPADSSGSHGLSLNIIDKDSLDQAVKLARGHSETAIVQQQVSGREVRFTVIEGQLVSILYRQPASVTGDGLATMAQLIKRENEYRQGLQFEYLPYPQLDATNLSMATLTDQSILAAGETTILNGSSMVSAGASVYDIANEVHDTYKQTACRLATALNSDFIIVDMMIQDVAVPQSKDNYAFIEFNTAPALRLYYGIRDRAPYDIVSKLADMIDERSRR